ncbi:unnamed protein product [Protopolystoma xenopodis]|uniref:Uncharacterized protein n=1 Tax=Protopolystoma xenopodis TaxID=117903 RepID=A0A3S5B9L9_9PLAT|nr:unnamed protein product [Protopolystoma xenopodis]
MSGTVATTGLPLISTDTNTTAVSKLPSCSTSATAQPCRYNYSPLSPSSPNESINPSSPKLSSSDTHCQSASSGPHCPTIGPRICPVTLNNPTSFELNTLGLPIPTSMTVTTTSIPVMCSTSASPSTSIAFITNQLASPHLPATSTGLLEHRYSSSECSDTGGPSGVGQVASSITVNPSNEASSARVASFMAIAQQRYLEEVEPYTMRNRSDSMRTRTSSEASQIVPNESITNFRLLCGINC